MPFYNSLYFSLALKAIISTYNLSERKDKSSQRVAPSCGARGQSYFDTDPMILEEEEVWKDICLNIYYYRYVRICNARKPAV